MISPQLVGIDQELSKCRFIAVVCNVSYPVLTSVFAMVFQSVCARVRVYVNVCVCDESVNFLLALSQAGIHVFENACVCHYVCEGFWYQELNMYSSVHISTCSILRI